MLPLIDIHTHNSSSNEANAFCLKNIILPDQVVPNEGFYSAGWHPWFIKEHSLNEIEQKLTLVCPMPQIIAVGECGLDRAINLPMNIQTEVFELHLHQAKELHKPLIVHAVRSYSDILQLLKKHHFQLPIIFHNYSGNEQQTKQFLKFNPYFSFGESVKKNRKMVRIINAIPADRLFLETDESELSIEKIYLSAATALGTPFDELTRQMNKNFRTVFGDGLVKQD